MALCLPRHSPETNITGQELEKELRTNQREDRDGFHVPQDSQNTGGVWHTLCAHLMPSEDQELHSEQNYPHLFTARISLKTSVYYLFIIIIWLSQREQKRSLVFSKMPFKNTTPCLKHTKKNPLTR